MLMPLWRPLSWYRQRKRAKNLGRFMVDRISGEAVRYWLDEETDTVWMATSRFSLFAVELPWYRQQDIIAKFGGADDRVTLP